MSVPNTNDASLVASVSTANTQDKRRLRRPLHPLVLAVVEQQEDEMGPGDISRGIEDQIFGSIVSLVAVVAIAAGSAAFALGVWIATPKKPQRHAAAEVYDDLLVHPETTPEVKWVKMTTPTRDTLLEIYAENMDECSRYIQECDRVTIGEAAIMWLMDRAEDK